MTGDPKRGVLYLHARILRPRTRVLAREPPRSDGTRMKLESSQRHEMTCVRQDGSSNARDDVFDKTVLRTHRGRGCSARQSTEHVAGVVDSPSPPRKGKTTNKRKSSPPSSEQPLLLFSSKVTGGRRERWPADCTKGMAGGLHKRWPAKCTKGGPAKLLKPDPRGDGRGCFLSSLTGGGDHKERPAKLPKADLGERERPAKLHTADLGEREAGEASHSRSGRERGRRSFTKGKAGEASFSTRAGAGEHQKGGRRTLDLHEQQLAGGRETSRAAAGCRGDEEEEKKKRDG